MNKIFQTLIGNNVLKRNIGVDIRRGHNSHAYIIEGDKGSGKRTIAELIASALSCEHRFDEDSDLPCGECNNCRRIKKGISSDIVRITPEGKASIGIEAVRKIKDGLYVTPNDSDTRTYIIESADLLTPQAQNALLLSIEEPPSFAVFLLLVEDSTKLLETIRSRAQCIRTDVFSAHEVSNYLKELPGGAELSRRNPDKFNAAVSLSGGSLGKAADLMRGGDDASALLKCRKRALELVSHLTDNKTTEPFKIIKTFAKTSAESKEIFYLADNAIRDLCVLKKTDDESDAFLTFFTDRNEADETVSDVSFKKLLYVHECLCNAVKQLDSNMSVKTVYINLILSCQTNRRYYPKG